MKNKILALEALIGRKIDGIEMTSVFLRPNSKNYDKNKEVFLREEIFNGNKIPCCGRSDILIPFFYELSLKYYVEGVDLR